MEISSLGLSSTEIQVQAKSLQIDNKPHNKQNIELSKLEIPPTEFINGRYILLQNQLNSLQYEYTREQTRLSLLEQGMVSDEELVKVLYANSPLFNESLDELIHEKSALLEKIRSKKEQLKVQIEVVEIETSELLPFESKNPSSDLKNITLDKSDNKENSNEELDSNQTRKLHSDLKRKAIEIKNAMRPFKDTYHIEKLITG